MQRERDHDACTDDCGAIVAERNLYYTGKFMGQREFADEQRYFLGRHREHNRLLHGFGIVCGLRVTEHPNPECRNEWVVVRSGVAIDCCGRDVVLANDLPFRFPFRANVEGAPDEAEEEPEGEDSAKHKPPESSKAAEGDEADTGQTGPEQEYEPESEHDLREEFLLCIRYAEEEIEQVPALYHETCDPARTHANRVRETARVDLRRLDEVGEGCWKTRGGEVGYRDDCDDTLPAKGGGCLEADCPCGSCVPLALVRFYPERPDLGFELNTSGRRTLPAPPEYLTHVAWINWPHGGEVTVDELAEAGGTLEIGFDRRLLEDGSEATGINEHTLQVVYGSAQEDLEFLPFDNPPYADGDRAVYSIDSAYLDAEGRRSIAGSVVYVTLKSNFVLDCHENPVDGDYLRAVLPSGDGIPGGTFESWFRVVPGAGTGREA